MKALALALIQAMALRRRARQAEHYGDLVEAARLRLEEIAVMRAVWP